jgi:hypothetical protein
MGCKAHADSAHKEIKRYFAQLEDYSQETATAPAGLGRIASTDGAICTKPYTSSVSSHTHHVSATRHSSVSYKTYSPSDTKHKVLH